MSDPLIDLAQLEGVPSAVAAATASVDAVLRDRGLRQVSVAQREAALLGIARGSVALEADSSGWLPGAIRVSGELIELAATLRHAPAQALARTHVLLARGQVGDAELGRMSGGSRVEERMTALMDLLAKPSAAPSLVKAAVAHAEIAVVRPFGAASGLVARTIEHLILITGGIDPQAMIMIEQAQAEEPEAYRDRLASYQHGGIGDVRGWIVHCATALSRGAELSPLNRTEPR